MKDLVSQKDFGPVGDSGGIWRMVGSANNRKLNKYLQARTILNKHEYQRYLLLTNLTTDKGRGRAWLRLVKIEA